MSIGIENDERIDGIQGQIHLSLALSSRNVAGFLCTLAGADQDVFEEDGLTRVTGRRHRRRA
jgi:hypothetical protein